MAGFIIGYKLLLRYLKTIYGTNFKPSIHRNVQFSYEGGKFITKIYKIIKNYNSSNLNSKSIFEEFLNGKNN